MTIDVLPYRAVVLFTQKNSIYNKLGVECYDKEKNALTYNGHLPVVAHPPCRAWGKLSHFAKPEPGEKELALFAVDIVRKNGGVLEHPRHSRLWPNYLPYPGQIDTYGGFTLCINQHWFGHRAEKNTFLYIVGINPKDIPEYKLNFNSITHCISSSKKNKFGKRYYHKKECSKTEREATPINLALWLLEVATKCKK